VNGFENTSGEEINSLNDDLIILPVLVK